jgi:Sec-independent protein translocase protein TatA
VFGTRKVLEEIRDLREEMRELRAETRDLHAQNMETLRFMGEVIRRNELAFIESRDEMRELRAESGAHTRALFALIDRLEGGGAAPAT